MTESWSDTSHVGHMLPHQGAFLIKMGEITTPIRARNMAIDQVKSLISGTNGRFSMMIVGMEHDTKYPTVRTQKPWEEYTAVAVMLAFEDEADLVLTRMAYQMWIESISDWYRAT